MLAGVVGQRRGWALYAGSALQLLVIASGVVVPVMYILGVIFAALWFTGIWLARKCERKPFDHGLTTGADRPPPAGRGPQRAAAVAAPDSQGSRQSR